MGNIQFKDCCLSKNNIEIDSDDEPEIIYKKENIKMVQNNYKPSPGPPIFI